MTQPDLRMSPPAERGRALTILVDGQPLGCHEGESIAAALLAAGRRSTRVTARTPEPRGHFCGMGGGPAGLAAARTAARHGVRVLLVDENAELGGQYYRQLPAAFSGGAGTHPVKEQAEGRRLMDEVRGLGGEVMAGAGAWGIFDQRTVAVATQEETTRIAADTVVLAPGAYDRPVPFPGWTLPGVLPAGGAGQPTKTPR